LTDAAAGKRHNNGTLRNPLSKFQQIGQESNCDRRLSGCLAGESSDYGTIMTQPDWLKATANMIDRQE